MPKARTQPKAPEVPAVVAEETPQVSPQETPKENTTPSPKAPLREVWNGGIVVETY